MQRYSIWTPVVIGKLKETQSISLEKIYGIEKIYKSSEDIRVRVKNCRAEPQGKVIEILLKVDILCLAQDFNGSMHLIIKEEILKEQVALSDFDNPIDKNIQVKYIINVLNTNAYANLEGQYLEIAIAVDVTIVATCEQIVNLSLAEEVAPAIDILPDLLTELKAELEEIKAEKEVLKHQIFLYERDITSLKKGLKKAESKNTTLNKEVEAYHNIVEQLKAALREKEWRLNRYENVYYSHSYDEMVSDEEVNVNLGSRIKRMFMTS